MSPGPKESRPPRGGPAHKPSATKPTQVHATKNRPPSQVERVKTMLAHGWVCGVGFLNPADGYPPILRYTGRIHELRRQGYQIDRRACQHPWHDHDAQMWEWRLVGRPGDTPRLIGIGNV